MVGWLVGWLVFFFTWTVYGTCIAQITHSGFAFREARVRGGLAGTLNHSRDLSPSLLSVELSTNDTSGRCVFNKIRSEERERERKKG